MFCYDQRTDAEHPGGIIYPNWPVNIWGIPQEEPGEMAGERDTWAASLQGEVQVRVVLRPISPASASAGPQRDIQQGAASADRIRQAHIPGG